MSQPQHPYRHGCPICHITKTRLPFCIHRKHQRIIAMMALFQYERDLIEHLAGELGDLAQGHSLAAICRRKNLPAPSTIYKWLAESPRIFGAIRARARTTGRLLRRRNHRNSRQLPA